MMVLHHSVGLGNARTSFTGALGGFRFESLSKKIKSTWLVVCIARRTNESFGAEHSNRSFSTSEFQNTSIDAEACANV